MSNQFDKPTLDRQVSVHSILADVHVEGYNELYNQCNTEILEKFARGNSTTIYHSAMQNIMRYRPDPVFALVLYKTFLPITERDVVKSLVSQGFSADYVRVAMSHLTRVGVIEKKSGALTISSTILPPTDYDVTDDALPKVRQLIDEAYSKGTAFLDQEPELFKNIRFVKAYQNPQGYWFIIPNPVFNAFQVRDLMRGEIEFLLSLMPLKELQFSKRGYSSIRTAVFESMMKEPIFPKEYIDKAPDFVPDIVLDISREVLRSSSSHKFIRDDRITIEGERLLNIRLGTPLATWRYVEFYDIFPHSARKKPPQALWESILPRLQMGIIEEILREFVSEWHKKANDQKWREDFLRICRSEEYYDMYQIARQLGLNANTVEHILRQAWQKGLCGVSVSSHGRLY